MTTKTKKQAKAKAKRTPDLVRIERLAAMIASYPAGPDSGLIEMLQAQEGLKTRQRKDGSWQARMAGLEAGARSGEADAVTNWANAGRRLVRGAA